MQVGVMENNTDIDGVRAGSDAAAKSWQECKASCMKAAGCAAFVYDNRTSCPEGACCWCLLRGIVQMIISTFSTFST